MGPLLLLALASGALAALKTTAQRQQRAADAPVMGINADTGYLPAVRDLAVAIASAEGFGVPHAIPTIAHNPGDLVIPGWTGQKLGAERISVFSSDGEGWTRLYHQLQLIVDSRSRVYSLEMTLSEFAAKWTATEQGIWTQNVVQKLNATGYHVNENSTLDEVLR